MLYTFVLGSGKKVLRWCQGKVIKVLPENAKPTIVVLWDPMPDVKGKEDLSDETQQVIAPCKWNKDVEGAWRMDNNVEIVENTEEHEVMDLNDDGKGNGLESEIDLSGEEESEVKAVVTMNKIITSRFFYIIGSQIILLNQSSYGEDRVSSTWSNEYLLLENRQKS